MLIPCEANTTKTFYKDGIAYQTFTRDGKDFTRRFVITKTHGMSRSRIYEIWKGMRRRCNNPRAPKYEYYGGKGVRVCEEWDNSENGFTNFLEWSNQNGYSDELSIDRINSELNYSPDNCRWIPLSENRLIALSKRKEPKYIYTGINRMLMKKITFTKISDFEILYPNIDGRRVSDCCLGRRQEYKGWTFSRVLVEFERVETISGESTVGDELLSEVRSTQIG